MSLTLTNLALTNAKTTAQGANPMDYTSSDGRGGAVCAQGELVLTNSTVSGNSTTGTNAGGGGVFGFQSVTLTSSILANNRVKAGPSDCEMGSGTATGSNNNLIQATDKACSLTNGANGNIVGQDPKLGALADNGCVTKAGAPGSAACVETHALLTGSPAIDAGTADAALTTDQRGQARSLGSQPDIGAYEVGKSAPPTAGSDSVSQQTATLNQPFSPTLTTPANLFTDDGTLALTVTGLPAGLSYTDKGDGTATISGTPTASGTFTVTIIATDANGQKTTQTFTMTVQASSAAGSPAATPIPTLGTWGLALLGGLLALIGDRRRRRP